MAAVPAYDCRIVDKLRLFGRCLIRGSVALLVVVVVLTHLDVEEVEWSPEDDFGL